MAELQTALMTIKRHRRQRTRGAQILPADEHALDPPRTTLCWNKALINKPKLIAYMPAVRVLRSSAIKGIGSAWALCSPLPPR